MFYNLKCHCWNVELEVETVLKNFKQCNCSICIRKNAKMCMVSKDSIQITKGEKNLTSYKFNTMIAEHFFVKLAEYILIIIEEVTPMVLQ